MAMPERPSILLGLESCIDIHTNTPPNAIGRLAERTKSGLGAELSAAQKALSREEDGEIAADGKDIEALASEIKKSGIRTERRLGGNAAIEASQLLSLGARGYFAGNVFRRQVRPNEIFSKKTDFGFAHESEQNPLSLILQHKSSRFIICDGRGRRFRDLKNQIASLPKIARKLQEKEALSAISLPGWHVIFAEGISEKDADFVIKNLSKIRESGIMMFTDAGSFGDLGNEDIMNLWQIYGTFGVIGMNESEFRKLCSIHGIKTGNIPQALSELLQKSYAHTIWLHSRDFQESVSKKYGRDALKNAETNAEAAAVLHIENGGYPDAEGISKRRLAGKRIRLADSLKSFIIRKLNIAGEPSFVAQKIRYEVGAGDVSSAAYLWSLMSLQNARPESPHVYKSSTKTRRHGDPRKRHDKTWQSVAPTQEET